MTHKLEQGKAINKNPNTIKLHGKRSIKSFDQGLSLSSALVQSTLNQRLFQLEYQIIHLITYRHSNCRQRNSLPVDQLFDHQSFGINLEEVITIISRAERLLDVVAGLLPLVVGNFCQLLSEIVIVDRTLQILPRFLRLQFCLSAIGEFAVQFHEFFGLEGGEGGRSGVVWQWWWCRRRGGGGGDMSEGSGDCFLELETEGKIEVGFYGIGGSELDALQSEYGVEVVPGVSVSPGGGHCSCRVFADVASAVLEV